ncbi:MAG: hypothetical protein WD315_01080 [Balneolaceae bacterium]
MKDPGAIEPSGEAERLSSRFEVMADTNITPESPFLYTTLYRIDEMEYSRRIEIERTLQHYRPKWGFLFLSSLAAGLAFYAASSDRFSGSPGSRQPLALNGVGGLMTLLALTNMSPSGDPVSTGETRFLRESGQEILSDTVQVESGEGDGYNFQLEYLYGGEVLANNVFVSNGEVEWAVRLPDLFRDRSVTGSDPGELTVNLYQNGRASQLSLPIKSFLRPMVVVTSPVAELRRSPEIDGRPPLTVVGNNSELELIGQVSDQWYEVRFGGSRLYLSANSGNIQWMGAETVANPAVNPVGDVPFGEVSVEFSVPVLKDDGQRDAALLLSNHRGNRIGLRRYLERDLQLMELYFRDAFRVPESSIHFRYMGGGTDRFNPEQIQVGKEGTLYLYLTGFAALESLEGSNRLQLLHLNETGEETRTDLGQLLLEMIEPVQGRVVVFADLVVFETDSQAVSNSGTSAYRHLAEEMLSVHGESALIFGSRPDQRPGLYESLRFEMNYHHIFPFYLAQGWQQRRTLLSDLVRYIDTQVDYTSRRLHNRTQTIQAYGKLSFDLRD